MIFRIKSKDVNTNLIDLEKKYYKSKLENKKLTNELNRIKKEVKKIKEGE
ncbi:MAG: hypothetical protein HPY57_13110 [Ignavibacteria bacterium]|nr:hypothetical protein [Ignavibacteria bacterium]